MKKVLVTGAAGFIGSHVVAELLALKPRPKVRALIRPGEPVLALEGMDVEKVQGDLLDKAAVGAAMEGVDTVFHLAAIYAMWLPDYRNLWEVNMQGSRNILWSALRNKVKRVVYTSSIAAIGIAPGRQISSEKTIFNQYALGSHYILSKYLSQQEALGFVENGLDVVVINPAFPFGTNDIGPTPTGKLIVDIVKGTNRFRFAGGLNIVDVRDVARGHVLAAQKGKPGEIYLMCNKNVTLNEFARMACEAAGIGNRLSLRLPLPLVQIGTRP